MTDTKNKRLLIQLQNGQAQILEFPEAWKVTFGPFYPGGKGGAFSHGNALRIYETKEKQRACFVGVTSFRDLSIPVLPLNAEEVKIIEDDSKNLEAKLKEEFTDEQLADFKKLSAVLSDDDDDMKEPF